jgi:hypothetical protein
MNPSIDDEIEVLDIRSILEYKASLDKIIISKSEIKHTNDKIELTVYMHNRDKFALIHNIKKDICDINLLGMAKSLEKSIINKESISHSNKNMLFLFAKK